MNTKKFDCSPSYARIDSDGSWCIQLRVITDNSEHQSTCNIGKDGEVKSVYCKYTYLEPQRLHVIGLSRKYHEACKETLAKFSEQHNLKAHNALYTWVKFDEKAEITEFRERFFDIYGY